MQMTHTYNLIEARISIEAGKLKKKVTKKKREKKEKRESISSLVFESFSCMFFFSFFQGWVSQVNLCCFVCLFVFL